MFIKEIVFDLHTTYNSLLSSIKQDHLIELHKINLINCKITDKDIKMLKKSVKNLPNVELIKDIMKLRKRRRSEENSFDKYKKMKV